MVRLGKITKQELSNGLKAEVESKATQQEFNEHKADDAKHLQEGERANWDAKIDSSEKGEPNGVATLSNVGIIPDSQLPPKTGVNWVLIDTFEDENTGTILDFDTGEMTQYDLYKITFVMGADGINADSNIFCQVNNITSNNYRYSSINEATISEVTNQTSWELFEATRRSSIMGEYIIRGKAYEAGAWRFPSIMGSGTAWTLLKSLMRGYVNINTENVNRIRVFSDSNMAGKMQVYGRNL